MAFLRPKSREELLNQLAEHPDYIMVAGATDIWPKIHRGAIKTNDFIDLTSLPAQEPVIDGSGAIHLPAGTTAAYIVAHGDDVLKRWPVLVEGAKHLGSTLIRNRATLAGNLCTASPCGDMVLALVTYDAKIKLSSVNGERIVPISEFLLGPGKTCRAANEWVEEIIISSPVDGTFSKFCKTGRRNALIIAVASMGLLLRKKQNKVIDITVAFGSVGPTTLRAKKVEEFLKGKELSADVIAEAAQIAYNEVSPINDQRASAEYRRQVCRDYLAATLEEASR